MVEGGCRCGACRYIVDRLRAVYCCHCTDCQTGSGSAFSEQALMPSEALSATGPIQSFAVTSPSGHALRHVGCAECATRLWNENAARPGSIVLRVGTLDVTTGLEPCAHIWVVSKQNWVILPDGVACFDRMEPLAGFLTVLMAGSKS